MSNNINFVLSRCYRDVPPAQQPQFGPTTDDHATTLRPAFLFEADRPRVLRADRSFGSSRSAKGVGAFLRGLVQIELPDQLAKRGAFVGKRCGSGARLLDHGCVLLRGLV